MPQFEKVPAKKLPSQRLIREVMKKEQRLDETFNIDSDEKQVGTDDINQSSGG